MDRPGLVIKPMLYMRLRIVRLFVLGLLVGEPFSRSGSISKVRDKDQSHLIAVGDLRSKLSQFSSHHLLRYIDILVCHSIVDRESEPDKAGQNRSSTSLSLDDRRCFPCACRPEIGEWNNIRSCAECKPRRRSKGVAPARAAEGGWSCSPYLSIQIASTVEECNASLPQYHCQPK